jgi:hypothetical protein
MGRWGDLIGSGLNGELSMRLVMGNAYWEMGNAEVVMGIELNDLTSRSFFYLCCWTYFVRGVVCKEIFIERVLLCAAFQ